MRKFLKVYVAPGYPVDPQKQSNRLLDGWINALDGLVNGTPREMRFVWDGTKYRTVEYERRN